MFFDAWHWPQWTALAVIIIRLLSAAVKHGEPMPYKVNFPVVLLQAALAAFVLYAGGFWR